MVQVERAASTKVLQVGAYFTMGNSKGMMTEVRPAYPGVNKDNDQH